MKSFITLALLFSLFTSTASTSKNLDKGFKTLSKNKPDKALVKFNNALKENPDCALCLYGVALIISDSTNSHYDLERAYKLIHQAIDLIGTNDLVQLPDFNDAHVDPHELAKLASTIEHQQYEHLDVNDLLAFSAYVKLHHNAITLDSFKEHRDKLGYLQALELNTIESYNTFIKKYPQATDNLNARVRRNKLAFEKAKGSKDVHALDEFIKKYPQAKQTSEAITIRNQWAYIALLEKEKELTQIKIEKQGVELKNNLVEIEIHKAQNETLIVGLFLMVLVLGLAFYGYLMKRKANRQISQQKNDIEKKNLQIIDSLKYARYIQQAILPSVDSIKSKFKDAFVYYKPKDIVSGDFYWFYEIDNKKILAVIDCTGHGVPGAFMSMIGNTLLNLIVKTKKITAPDQILFELRKEVIKSLAQNEKQEQHEGMDITLVVVEDLLVSYSGAYNPLVHISGTENNVIKANRMPIGTQLKSDDKPFTAHQFTVKQGDVLYLYSDGYQDQFSSDDDKKYGSKKFRQFLQELSSSDSTNQLKKLDQEQKNWQKDTNQTDDITIMGLKF